MRAVFWPVAGTSVVLTFVGNSAPISIANESAKMNCISGLVVESATTARNLIKAGFGVCQQRSKRHMQIWGRACLPVFG
jgi:hypothetical protein